MATTTTYIRGAELPDLALTLTDDNGDVIDLTGHTPTALVGVKNQAAALEKTSGITVAATAPNFVIAWADGDLDLPVGAYTLQAVATTGGRDRMWQIPFKIAAPVEEPA